MAVVPKPSFSLGELVKVRYAGQPESTARSNITLSEFFVVESYLATLLESNHQQFLDLIALIGEADKNSLDFLANATLDFAHGKGEEFVKAYQEGSDSYRKWVALCELSPEDHMHEGFFHVGNGSLTSVPESLLQYLPAEITAKIVEVRNKISNDKGNQNYHVGIVTTATPGWTSGTSFVFHDGTHKPWHELVDERIYGDIYDYEALPISRDEMLADLQTRIEDHEPTIAAGGVEAVISARRQYLLEQMKKPLENANSAEKYFEVMQGRLSLPSPHTGVYMMIGDRRFAKGKSHLVVSANPWETAENVSAALGLTLPEYESFAYDPIEVPEKVLHLVQPEFQVTVKLTPLPSPDQ